MNERDAGILIIVLGLGLVLAGAVVLGGGLSWFGRLPGDLRWEGERGKVFIPITSMILVSIVLSLLMMILRRVL